MPIVSVTHQLVLSLTKRIYKIPAKLTIRPFFPSRGKDCQADRPRIQKRILASDHKTAIEHGADAFLPKPMSSLHLLKLLRQAADRAREQAELLNKAVANERPDNNATDSRSRPDALRFAFGTDSFSTGRTLAADIRKRSDIPIFLASDGDFSLVEFGGDVDSILTKHPPSRDALVAAIAEA